MKVTVVFEHEVLADAVGSPVEVLGAHGDGEFSGVLGLPVEEEVLDVLVVQVVLLELEEEA